MVTGYTFREPVDSDIDGVYELIRELEIADAGACEFTEEDMQVVWRLQKPGNTTLVEDADGSLAAYSAINVRHPTRLRTWSGVLPPHRGRGIGTRLLELVDARARELALEAPEGEGVI